MKKYIFILVTFVLIICACSSPQRGMDSPVNAVNIDVKNNEELDFKKCFDSVKYVALETTKEILIGEITKMFVTNEHIIIFDQKSMEIFLFGIDGKFTRRIGKKGEGPDEYMFINDIQFDKENMLIFAHERFRNCIYTYDLSGNLVDKTQKSLISFNSFFKTKEGLWVYSCFSDQNQEYYNLTLLTSNLQSVRKQFFPQKEFVNVTFSPTFVSDEHGRVFFYYPSSNVVYEISGTDVIPYLQVDFGEKTMPYDKIIEMDNKEEYDKLLSGKTYLGDISRCFINKNRIFFSFIESGLGIVHSYNCFYNIKSKKGYVFNNPFMASVKYPISTQLLYSTDTMLIYPVYPSIFTDDSLTELSKSLSADIQFDSNVILAICSLKK
ncbi:6-bladed beta-propeller [Bacteroides sp.]|uniref:6-bladed beta-propeller n=1 Tax=Bacteroides sp. TaxID=29523 RepID=UPI00262F0006|nr:6-bladed beta-propeller [Bacteroides sp.]MDD3037192.1 6-bladed beta-propeller [Bacteroides sp.]